MQHKTTYDGSTKIWSGREKDINCEGYSCLGLAIFQNMKKYSETICQISDTDGISLTNKEMLTLSIRIAQRLEIEDGSIIGVMSIGSTYQAAVLIAAFLRGIVVHPINNSFDKKTTQHVFGITRPKIVFCDAGNYETLMAACGEINLGPKVYTIKGQIEGVDSLYNLMEATGTEDDFCPRECQQDDTAAIMGSSGTTGLPKGVCISHRNFFNFMENTPKGNKIVLACTNFGWISGVISLLFGILYGKTRICTEEQFSPKVVRQLIEKYKINDVMMSPLTMSTFIKSGEAELCNSSSLQSFIVGGTLVSHQMYVKMQELLRQGTLYICYGGTEFQRVSTNSNVNKPKYVGQICDGVKVRIVDDDGNNLGIGETGEILVCNNIPWNGYYGNSTESKNILDSEGWFHTGDIGLFDEDGDLHFIDRKKFILKYRRFQYSVQEIESCILSLSDIAEVCVFATKSDELGDLATAAVIRNAGSKITASEIKDHVEKELPQHMWLHGGVYFVEMIPKTPSGKYQRLKIRDVCLKSDLETTIR